MRTRRIAIDREARADYLARLEYGLNPVLNLRGAHQATQTDAQDDTPTDDRPGGDH